MANFVKADIVIIPFPFSDLSGSKRRPALVLAALPGDDVLLCQITSQVSSNDPFAIAFSNSDLTDGALPIPGNIRPCRIFTADKNIILRKAASLNTLLFQKVVETIVGIIST